METFGKQDFTNLIDGFGESKFFYVSPQDFPDFSENFSEEVQEVAYKIGKSETGAVLVENEKKILIIPPFPMEKTFSGDKDYLIEQMEKKFNLGIILLRLGEYSFGVFEGDELKIHKTGTQFVGGKTKAGGQSAARFARVREGQINDFFKKVCEHLREKFSPYGDRINFVFFGGDSQTIKTFLKTCDCLEKFRVMSRVLNVRHMKLESLKNSLKEVWKYRIYEI